MRPVSTRKRPTRAVVGAVLLAATLVAASTAQGVGAQTSGSSTTVTASAGGTTTGIALLTGVSAANTSATTATATFTFAGPVVPDAAVRRMDGPVLQSPVGTPIPLAGNALMGVHLVPASGVDLGSCPQPAAPVPGVGEVLVSTALTCVTAAPGPWPVVLTSRAVPTPAGDAALLAAALGELVGGPTPAEEAAGLSSPFSAATAGTVSSVTIQPSGRVDVDLAAGIVAALPTPDGAQVVRELDGTIAQYLGATGARYTIGGDCAAFGTWTGLTTCDRTEREVHSAGFAQTYTGPDRITAGGAGPLVEVVERMDFEAELDWVAALDVPAGNDVVASIAFPAGGTSVEVTFTVVALPTPAPVSPTFTG